VPKIKSAKKRVEVAERNRQRNRYWKSSVRTVRSRVEEASTDAKSTETQTALNEAFSVIDRAVSKGVLHRNTGARRKARLCLLVTAKAKTEAKPTKKKASASKKKAEQA
jgi:small subunit ribosomal protein S20